MNGCRCTQCQRRGRIVRHGTEPRSWADITLIGRRVLLPYTPKEIACPTHGRLQEEIPWAAAQARTTYRREYRICALCQIMPQKAAAEEMIHRQNNWKPRWSLRYQGIECELARQTFTNEVHEW